MDKVRTTPAGSPIYLHDFTMDDLDKEFECPTGHRYHLQSLTAAVDTTVTAGDRNPCVIVTTDTGYVQYRVRFHDLGPACGWMFYIVQFGPGGIVVPTVGPKEAIEYAGLPEITLTEGMTVRFTDTESIDIAADDLELGLRAYDEVL